MSRTPRTATQLDRAIDSILRHERGPVVRDEGELVVTARLLRRALPRLHPRFGFEEHLAARLAAAHRVELAPAAARVTMPTPIRPDIEVGPPAPAEGGLSHERRRRHLVAGGAIASGVSIALPIAGAAIVAWRRSRSSGGLL
ncbi:MAG: hypothetical protein AB1Z67_07300 [Candidatus Limnocylindrales bacterium]